MQNQVATEAIRGVKCEEGCIAQLGKVLVPTPLSPPQYPVRPHKTPSVNHDDRFAIIAPAHWTLAHRSLDDFPASVLHLGSGKI
jgi:hypothetical protein